MKFYLAFGIGAFVGIFSAVCILAILPAILEWWGRVSDHIVLKALGW